MSESLKIYKINPARNPIMRVISCTLAILFLVNFSFAQDLPPNWPPRNINQDSNNPTDNVANPHGPEITFVNTKYNFGKVYDIEKVKCEFDFTNTGESLLTIDKVKPSCGCTTSELAIKDYLPGETGHIEVVFDPKDRHGVQHKTVKVSSNCRSKPEITLEFEVEVEPLLKVDLKQLNFGQVIMGTEHAATINITTPMRQLEIKSMQINGPHLEGVVDGIEDITDEDGNVLQQAKLQFTVAPNIPKGYFNRMITLDATMLGENGEPMDHQIQFSISANIVGDVEVKPERLSLGRLTPGTEFRREVRLTSRTGKEFAILGIKLQDDPNLNAHSEVVVDLQTESDIITVPTGELMHRIIITGTAPENPGRFFGLLNVATDNEDEPVVEIRYFGIVAK